MSIRHFRKDQGFGRFDLLKFCQSLLGLSSRATIEAGAENHHENQRII